MATQVVFLQETILTWDGRNRLAVTFLIRNSQSEPMEEHICWVMEWWHQLGLIRSLLKTI